MLNSSVGIPLCIFMRMDANGRIGRIWTQLDAFGRKWTHLDATGRKWVHFRIEKRFTETGMKKAKERGAETAEKLDENTVLLSILQVKIEKHRIIVSMIRCRNA